MSRLRVTDRAGGIKEIEAVEGDSLMLILRDAGLGIAAICGGQCACGTCHCLIHPTWFDSLPVAKEGEIALLDTLEYFETGRSRLTCQIIFDSSLDGLTLSIAPEE